MSEICTYCGEKPIYAKGLCRPCYERNRRNGTPKKLWHHKAALQKIEVWKEQDKNYTKAARVLGCSKQAVHEAVKLYYTPTNADRIRQMSDVDLCTWFNERYALAPWCSGKQCPPGPIDREEDCRKCVMDWLKSPEVDNEK